MQDYSREYHYYWNGEQVAFRVAGFQDYLTLPLI